MSLLQNHGHRADRLAAIRAIGLGLHRSYPNIDHNPEAHRFQIIMAALPQMGNVFAFVQQTTRLARMIHNRNNSRFAHAVNRAIQMITAEEAAPEKKPAESATVAQVVAA